ncbi:MAG: hypothetical protein KGS61_16305, partial [Verrucomicrobia bacterium]|nr:hypothetical protein [Verrucomicrobiota bacterium]
MAGWLLAAGLLAWANAAIRGQPFALPAEPPRPFELREGDRVVFVGDTLVEREQEYGYLEARMTAQFPDRNVTFRNLGWSADTP